jgi:hypothetical protein
MENSGVTKIAETLHGESFNAALFERMRNMHRAWLGALREMREIESEFGMRLLAAKNPSEATNICSEWMAKRAQVIASEHQAFAASLAGTDLGCDDISICKAGKEPDGDKTSRLDAG